MKRRIRISKLRIASLAGLLAAAVLLIVQQPAARAEYERPQVASTSSSASAEFRGAWAFNRGQGSLSGFEAYTVGIDTTKTINGNNPDLDNNGLFYYFDGSAWSRLSSYMTSGQTTWGINAMTGQVNSSYDAASLIIAGSKGRIAAVTGLTGIPGDTQTQDKFAALPVCKTGSGACTEVWTGIGGTGETREFYAVDAAPVSGGAVLVGGQTIKSSSYLGPIYAVGNTSSVTVASSTNGTPIGLGSARENIVGIKFADAKVAYVLTSTFSGDDRYALTGRNCDTPASQTVTLYRTTSLDGTNGFNKFYQVWSKTGTCGYGLAVGLANESTGYVRNNIWMATYDGVYSVTDQINLTTAPFGAVVDAQTSTQTGTAGKPVYAITAVRDRGGSNQNLILNPGLDVWTGTATAYGTLTNGTAYRGVTPYYWHTTAPAAGKDGGTTCVVSNTGDYQKVQVNSAGPVITAGPVMRVWPAKSYASTVHCNPAVNTPFTYPQPSSYYTRVDLTGFDGERFIISGKYRVQFHPRTGTSETMPDYASGGVSIGCAGTVDQPGTQKNINCSIKNRSQIRIYANATANGGTAIDQSTTNNDDVTQGWVEFTIPVTRQDLAIGEYYTTAGVVITPRRMDIEIRCEATFGADVMCDDIKVAEMSEPAIASSPTNLVTAVGQARYLAANKNANDISTPSTFATENQPTFSDVGGHFDYQAVAGSAIQHIYVAGTAFDTSLNKSVGNGASSLLSRTPTTMVGKIWAGTADTGSTQGSGYISVSCANTRQPTNTGSTLCQNYPQSYGWSLNLNQTTNAGTLTGRAWYGKSLSGAGDGEIAAAGTCQNNSAISSYSSGVNPYNLTGMCDTNTRTCWSSRTNRTVHSGYSCLTDYDCFGHCSINTGNICVNNGDCQLSSDTYRGAWSKSTNTAQLSLSPVTRLTCSSSNPATCTSIGWLSLDPADFSSTERNNPVTGTVMGVNYNTKYPNHNSSAQGLIGSNAGSHELSGWGRFITLAQTNLANFPDAKKTGWVSFRGSEVTAAPISKPVYNFGTNTTTNINHFFGCQDCYADSTGQYDCAFCTDTMRHSCVPADYPSWTKCTNFCLKNHNLACLTDADCGTDKGNTYTNDTCRSLGVCTGDSSTYCNSDTDCDSIGGYCNLGMFCRTAVLSSYQHCFSYGVNMSVQTGQYSGFAWSEDLGWLAFRGVGRSGTRYIQTLLGDIIAKGDIGNPQLSQPLGVNNCNATFLILAGGTIANNWCSALSSSSSLPVGFTPKQSNSAYQSLVIPKEANLYQSALGRIDIPGLINTTRSAAGVNYNKYNSAIVAWQPTSAATDISTPWNTSMGSGLSLGGKVYYADCSNVSDKTCTIDQAMQFKASADITSGTGAGLLVVRGNLKITQNMSYPTSNISDSRQLASLVVMVIPVSGDNNTGNLTIGNNVTQIVGAYYVSNAINTTADPSDSTVYTTPLVVRGLMIGQTFNFGRKYAGTSENPAPSELVIFDGRLQTNPIPGLADFSKLLPAAVTQP